MWAAYVAASNGASSPPDLAQYATGSALGVLQSGLSDNRTHGWTSHGSGPVLSQTPTVTGPTAGQAPPTVQIVDCVDDSNWLLYNADGTTVDNKPGGRRKVTATVQQQKGEPWKVTLFGAFPVGSC
jgi:hypothetical protein